MFQPQFSDLTVTRVDERGVMDKVTYDFTLSNQEPSEGLLACIEVNKWVDISRQRSGGGRAMDGVCRAR